MVSRPTFSARMMKPPVVLSVPPITFEPVSFVTGIDSPVTINSSSDERPSITSPSTGTFSPGRTRRRSPTMTTSSETSSSVPSGRQAPRGLWREVEQGADRARGLLAGAQLEHLPEQDQHGDHRGRFEIDRDRAITAAKRRREQVRKEDRHDAVEPRDADAHRDQREHVEIAWAASRSP